LFYQLCANLSVNVFVVLASLLINILCCDLLQKRMPIYNTMFSDLQRYPRYEVRLDTVDPVPRFIARQWRGKQSDTQAAAVCKHRSVQSSLGSTVKDASLKCVQLYNDFK